MPPLVQYALYLAAGARLNLFESGTLLSGGMQSLHGKPLYTDVFAFYGPLDYWAPALAGYLLPGATGPFVLDALIKVAYSVVAYRLAARISGRPRAALLVPVALALVGANGVRPLLALAAIACLARHEQRGGGRWLALTGVLGAGALLWLQDAGAWLAVALLVTAAGGYRSAVVRRVLRPGNLGLVVAGGAVAVAPVVVLFSLNGSLGAWLYSTLVFPNTSYTDRSATGYVVGLVRSWSTDSPPALIYHVTFYLLPYIVIVLAALGSIVVAVLRVRDPRTSPLRIPVATVVLAVYALLQLRLLASSVDEAKLRDVAGPTITVAVALALRGASRRRDRASRRPGRWAPTLVAVAVLTWFLVWPAQVFVHTQPFHASSVQLTTGEGTLGYLPLAGGSSPSTTMDELNQLVRAISRRTTADDRIFVSPISPYVYYLAQRENVTRYDYLDPVYTTPQVDAEMALPLATGQAAVVVLADNTFNGTPGAQLAPQTYAAIGRSYRAVEQIGPWTVLVPARSAP